MSIIFQILITGWVICPSLLGIFSVPGAVVGNCCLGAFSLILFLFWKLFFLLVMKLFWSCLVAWLPCLVDQVGILNYMIKICCCFQLPISQPNNFYFKILRKMILTLQQLLTSDLLFLKEAYLYRNTNPLSWRQGCTTETGCPNKKRHSIVYVSTQEKGRQRTMWYSLM